MKEYQDMEYHKTAEELVDIICKKTENKGRSFFRVLVAYYFTKVTSMMRVKIATHDRGTIPVNMYAINLGRSGIGKGYSTNIIEEGVINGFRDKFLQETFPTVALQNLQLITEQRVAKHNSDEDIEAISVKGEFDALGELAFSFDSGTSAAVKQMRHKLLMANAGSMNMEIDEIGSNLLGNVDVLKVFFELYDMGKVKQKLTKNTSDNIRSAEINGNTPTNMMLFGTPTKLFDGSKTEEETIAMIETGMGRRCFFGIDTSKVKDTTLSPEEIYARLTDTTTETKLTVLSDRIRRLAEISNFDIVLTMSKAVSILLITYKLDCEKRANGLLMHDTMRKAEMAHRYFKVLKVSGTYAFIDGCSSIQEKHIYNAIRLAEDSGKAFDKLLSRDRNYVKLAKYISSIGYPLTHVDMVEDLPFYKGSEAQKREMMNMAIAYGYRNNIIIKKSYEDGIEFLRGESLELTDLNKVSLSYSKDIATGYKTQKVKFTSIHILTQRAGHHWCSHGFNNGHRSESDALVGFNLVVLDVDTEISLKLVRLLLNDYTYHIYTTKRHTAEVNRFRIVLPITHKLKMSKIEYTEFMHNIYSWLPFNVDTGTIDRSRKWLSNPGEYEYNDGILLNALLFIPKTAKNDERKKFIADNTSLSNMERWFCNNTGKGNRSNQLIKYALLLVDAGLTFKEIQDNILNLNNKLPNKMKEAEIISTILATTSKAVAKRDTV